MIGISEVSDVAVSIYHQNLKAVILKENNNSYLFRHITIFLKVTFKVTNQQENETLVGHTAWKMIDTRNITKALNVLNLEPITNSVEWRFKFLGIADKQLFLIKFFFSIKVFLTDTHDSQDSGGREETTFYFTLPLPRAHEHWDIYLRLCMWDDYHIFLIAPLVFTRLLLYGIFHFIELPFGWLIDDPMFVCVLDELILGFVTAIWHWKSADLNSHRLSPFYYKANRLTKCASHPKYNDVFKCKI